MIPICAAPKRFAASLRCKSSSYSRFGKIMSSSSRSPITQSVKRFSTVSSLNLYGPREDSWWTGKKPIRGECPGVGSDGKIRSLPMVNFHPQVCTKQALIDYFNNGWTITEVLFSSLQGEEAFMTPPYHNLRHPLIFYYGHNASVFVNKMRVAGVIKDPVNPYFESIFETGVDEMSWDDMAKNEMTWPSVTEVRNYRKVVYDLIMSKLESLSESEVRSITMDHPLWSIGMGCEHERIHIETTSFLLNEAKIDHVKFPEYFPSYHESVNLDHTSKVNYDPVSGVDYPMNEFIDVSSQTVKLGKPQSFPTFGWDNEYGNRHYEIPEFRGSKYLISNGEFLEFVKDGGYAKRELWTDEGWRWRAFRNVKVCIS